MCVNMIGQTRVDRAGHKGCRLCSRAGLNLYFSVDLEWDIVSHKDTKTMKNFTMRVREEFAFMSYAEIISSVQRQVRELTSFGTYQEK